MCGIAGVVNLAAPAPRPEPEGVERMLAAIRHRGPDESGIYYDEYAAIGNARLSIVDIAGGQQPIENEDGNLQIVFNGEIFNYLELRPDLEARGHRFATQTDTEVLLHLFEEYGPECLGKLNGQFAFAIWDRRRKSLFLARDRLGVRPLFYTRVGNTLLFGSEIKALIAEGRVRAEIDPFALGQIFTFWSPLAPRTAFRDIFELPAGHWMTVRSGSVHTERYWSLGFAPAAEERPLADDVEELRSLLADATRIRLRADVPVGAYLSGGLDSSVTSALARQCVEGRLETFSIAFQDRDYDESPFQKQMAEFLGTRHHISAVTHEDIGRVFPEVIRHTEMPVMRTSPAPMFLLSKLVRDHGMKVVLTGEGADEFLGGYDIFKEAAIRRFWARQPESKARPMLLGRLYGDIAGLAATGPEYLAAFFGQGLGDVECPHYSHAIRWRNNGRTHRFFTAEVAAEAARGGAVENCGGLPPEGAAWGSLERGQYFEIGIFLSQYLLCSQGDRPAMAHSVEGRFPFLDYRVVEFCNRLPSRRKLNGTTEKFLLKEMARGMLPESIRSRVKRPYRAPIYRSFINPGAAWVPDLTAPARLKAAGFFKPAAVEQLLKKARSGRGLGETDDMALAGILSTQLVYEQFTLARKKAAALPGGAGMKLRHGGGAPPGKAEAPPSRFGLVRMPETRLW